MLPVIELEVIIDESTDNADHIVPVRSCSKGVNLHIRPKRRMSRFGWLIIKISHYSSTQIWLAEIQTATSEFERRPWWCQVSLVVQDDTIKKRRFVQQRDACLRGCYGQIWVKLEIRLARSKMTENSRIKIWGYGKGMAEKSARVLSLKRMPSVMYLYIS